MRFRISICLVILIMSTSSSVSAQTYAPQAGQQTATTGSYNTTGRRVMRLAQDLADKGDADGARSLARTAQRMPIQWQPNEQTPQQLIDSYAIPNQTHGNYQYSDAIPLSDRSPCHSTQPVCPPSARFSEPQQTWPVVQTCDWCQPRGIWAEAEFLYWWVREPDVAPLATTSTLGTPENEAGVLGLASTSVVLGNNQILDTARPGARLTLGYQMEPHFGFLMSYATIGGGADSRLIDMGDGILARPFDNLAVGNDSELINFPGLTSGTLTVNTDADVDTFEMLFRRDMGWIRSGFVDASLGYRFMRMDDYLSVREQSVALAGTATAGTLTDLIDQFRAENRFHGATFGLGVHWHRGDRLTVELNGKLSYGNSRRIVVVSGSTQTTDAAGGVTTNSGGLLAQESNIGVHKDNQLTYIAELGLVAKYRVTERAVFTIGYNVLHFDKVLRASDQIDLTVNTTQIPPDTLVGAGLPIFPGREEELLAHALRLGFEYTY